MTMTTMKMHLKSQAVLKIAMTMMMTIRKLMTKNSRKMTMTKSQMTKVRGDFKTWQNIDKFSLPRSIVPKFLLVYIRPRKT